eukprot:7078304-Karenia_brevis.AAC.1
MGVALGRAWPSDSTNRQFRIHPQGRCCIGGYDFRVGPGPWALGADQAAIYDDGDGDGDGGDGGEGDIDGDGDVASETEKG